ncbi:MAG TPA: hypothetical protein VE977_04690 [Pyrinomonadaceae bacterium]|nr:hypothetical protein [Pyrinomonadaceae bacterium]
MMLQRDKRYGLRTLWQTAVITRRRQLKKEYLLQLLKPVETMRTKKSAHEENPNSET